jgi:hypothetical protein
MRKINSGERDPDLVTIRTFTTRVDADLAKSALQAADIECLVSGDDCGGMRPSLSFTQGIKLVVRSVDADRASKVLGDKQAQNSN